MKSLRPLCVDPSSSASSRETHLVLSDLISKMFIPDEHNKVPADGERSTKHLCRTIYFFHTPCAPNLPFSQSYLHPSDTCRWHTGKPKKILRFKKKKQEKMVQNDSCTKRSTCHLLNLRSQRTKEQIYKKKKNVKNTHTSASLRSMCARATADVTL